MNARRDSSDEPTRGSNGGRALLIAAVVLAMGATGVLVLSDEAKLMRLGIVAALWAALVGAFVAARYRRQVADQEEAAAERQQRYELELEREIAARREYELEVAAEAKRQADEESRDDIAALRQELFGLRQTLESLLGGEFLVERYALRAESTRMRSLPDEHSLKRLPPAKPKEENVIPAIVQEAQTDLIERVREVHQPPKRKVEPLPRRAERPGGRTEFPRPEPIKPLTPQTVESREEHWQQVRVEHTPHPAELSDRWFVPDGLGTDAEPQPVESQPYAARQYVQQKTSYVAKNEAHTPKPTANRHNTVASGYMEPIARPRGGDSTGFAAPASGFGPGTSGYLPPVGRPDQTNGHPPAAANGSPRRPDTNGYTTEASGYTAARAESTAYAAPVNRAEASGYGRPANSADASGHGRPVNPAEASGYGRPASPAEASGYGRPVNRAEASGFGQPVSRAEASGFGQPVNRAEASGFGQPVSRAEASGFGQPVNRAEASGFGQPVSRADASGFGQPVNRAEASGYGRPANPAEASGYRQPVNRAEGYGQPAAQSSGYVVPVDRGEPQGRRRARDDADPTLDTGGGRRRRAEGQPTWQESRQNGIHTSHARPEGEPSGSHAAGRSVNDLLASHGSANSPSTPRRRRRREE